MIGFERAFRKGKEMNKKGMKALMTMTIAGLIPGIRNSNMWGEETQEKKDPNIEKDRIDRMNKVIRKQRGAQTFIIEGQEIEARNWKNAQRKFNNLKK